MRWLRRLALLVLLVVLFGFAIANRQTVSFRLLPEVPPLDRIPGFELPLFALLFAALFAGYAVGTLIEWTRNAGLRTPRHGPRR